MGNYSRFTEMKKDKKDEQGVILNEDSYSSDCYWFIFLFTALFFGWCVLQFLYAKYTKLFLGGIFISDFFFLYFSFQERGSGIRIFFLIYWLISAVVPFFIYTDGDGEKMRPLRILFQR